MDEFIRDLLQRVHAGETTFSPDDESANAKERFQLLATAFVHAEKNGLIEGVFAHEERSTGRALFDLVRIERGLTYKGDSGGNGVFRELIHVASVTRMLASGLS